MNYEKIARDKIKRLFDELRERKITNEEIAEWLECTPQNVYGRLKASSFSYKQIINIESHLEELKKAQADHNARPVETATIDITLMELR